MKRFICKITAFILIFGIVFLGTQNVLRYHWPEDTYTRYKDFENQQPNSIDVFAFGTSEMYSGYSPVAMYKSAGITGYNFALQNRSAMVNYYQLKYALKHQTPKLVILDFVCMFDSMLPSEYETIYRRAVDTMPDREIKRELISEICRVDEAEDEMNWHFPILRYHSMWNELSPADFEPINVYEKNYSAMKKGANLAYADFDGGQPYDIVKELWDTEGEPAQLADFSLGYYDRIIDLCNEKGIEVCCVLTPKVSDAAVYALNFPTMEQYLSERGVKCINYCDYDRIMAMDLSLYRDYLDASHLNVIGSVKFSLALAADLRNMYPELPDRRLDETVAPQWDAAWMELLNYYNSLAN